MTSARLDELTPEAQTQVLEFTAERFPGYALPGVDTRIRISGNRVEFRLIRENPATIDSVVAHMMITDAIAESILGSLVEKTP